MSLGGEEETLFPSLRQMSFITRHEIIIPKAPNETHVVQLPYPPHRQRRRLPLRPPVVILPLRRDPRTQLRIGRVLPRDHDVAVPKLEFSKFAYAFIPRTLRSRRPLEVYLVQQPYSFVRERRRRRGRRGRGRGRRGRGFTTTSSLLVTHRRRRRRRRRRWWWWGSTVAESLSYDPLPQRRAGGWDAAMPVDLAILRETIVHLQPIIVDVGRFEREG